MPGGGAHGLQRTSTGRQEKSMMKTLLMTAMAVLMTLTVSAADLAGTWKGSMETQGGPVDVTITIHPGATLAGKIKAGEYEGTIENAKLNGDNIAFDMNIDPGTVKYVGTVAGDEMKLNVTGTQGTKYTLVCRRQK